ncbi:MAG: YjjW family glycine radical enzyme activase [Desulfobacteraceae bacterium]|nr:YjjW family glycine radical enzyme activase [Desulfobacteraceae bacterium]
MKIAYINKTISFSAVDGPGNRMAIFFQGCQFDCIYCHNSETINKCTSCGLCIKECSTKALFLSSINKSPGWAKDKCIECDACLRKCPHSSSPKYLSLGLDDLLTCVKKVSDFISGVTLSGGEVLLQIEFVEFFVRKLKEKKISVFIDTNASVPWEFFERILPYVDQFMIDLKAYDNKDHIKLTSKNNNLAMQNIYKLGKLKKIYEVRTVISEDFFDCFKTVKKISVFISNLDKDIQYKLIKYRSHGLRKKKFREPSDDLMNKLKAETIKSGLNSVTIS